MTRTRATVSTATSLAAAAAVAAVAQASIAPEAQPAYELSDRMPVMGETVQVMAAPGVLLRNNETGGFFEPGVPTPQTVTVTLLRRLQDGDLKLLA